MGPIRSPRHQSVRAVRDALSALPQDLHYTWRTIRKNPAFVITTVLILALGVGVNTAIYSALYSIVLRPLPFHDPNQLFAVFSTQANQHLSHIYTSGPDYIDFRDQTHSFEHIADAIPYFTETLTGEGEPQVARCTAVSPNFFPMLGVHPLLGHLYRTDKNGRDDANVVIAYSLWRRLFHGDPHVIGRIIRLGGDNQTIIGVMPPLPDIYPQTEIWATLITDFQFMQWRGNRFLDVIGRLKPGVSPRQAEQELTTILHRSPETPVGMQEKLVSLQTVLTGNAKPVMGVLMAAAALVLLIACVNVATLLFARSESRKAEIAVRISLGASWRRVMQQLFTENLMFALLAGVLGLYLFSNTAALIGAAGFLQLPRSSQVGINLSVFGFALLIVCLTSVIFGLMPSIALSKTDLNSTLRTGRYDASPWSASRRTILIAAEVSLSVVLLVAAGLLMQSLSKMLHSDLGFEPEHLLTSYLRLSDGGFATSYQLSFYRRIFAELPNKPGVDSVAVADCVPVLRSATVSLTFAYKPIDPHHLPAASGCFISSEYFRAVRAPLLSGRFFNEHDVASSPFVAIINSALARRFWPTENPIGKRINVTYTGPGRRSDGRIRWREVVGVVGDLKDRGLDENADPAIYLPFYQDETGHDYRAMHLFVRGQGDTNNLSATVRATLRSVEPELPVTIESMTSVLSQSLAPRNFALLILLCFAGLATFLAGFGIYGVVTYAVARRSKEIGLRIAVGANRVDTVRMILVELVSPVGAGLLVGTLVALGGSRLMGSILYRTNLADSAVLLTAFAIMLMVTICAAALPAYRACSIDPLAALRSD